MRRDDLMKPDLISEVALLGSGVLLLFTIIVIVIAALTRMAPLP